MIREYLLKIVDVLVLLDVNLQDIEDSSVDVHHCCRDTSWSIDLAHEAVGVLKLDGGR